MGRHRLTDEQWALMEDIFPKNGRKPGRPWADHRNIMDGIFHVLVTGVPWRDLPEEFGPWITVYRRFARYRDDGTLERILERLQLKLNEEGKIDSDLFCIDGSNVRAHRSAAGAKKGALRKRPRMSRKTTPWGVPVGAGGQRSTQ